MAVDRSIWRELAISPSTDEREIRRAYARRLKIVHPEDDPQGFQALRDAYEQALHRARHAAWQDLQSAVPEAGQDAEAAAEPDADLPQPADEDQPADRDETRLDAVATDDVLAGEIARDQADRTEHQRRCDALLAALNRPTVDEESILNALIDVFHSRALGALDTHQSTEHWLGQLAAQRSPAFAVLVEPTVAFFGWDRRPVGEHWSPGLGALQHREDLDTLKRLRSPGHPAHASFVALAKPMRFKDRVAARFSPDFRKQIGDLLARIDYETPYVLNYLNPDSIAWWREHLSRPRFGLSSLALVIIPVAVCALIAAVQNGAGRSTVPPLIMIAGGLIGGLLSVLAGHYFLILPRWRLSQSGRSSDFWISCGWAVATAGLVLVAALVPPGLSDATTGVLVVSVGLIGAALVWWAAIVLDNDGFKTRLQWLFTWPPVFLPLWIVAQSALLGRPMLWVSLWLLLLLFAMGAVHLARRASSTPQTRRTADIGLISLAATGAALALASDVLPSAPLAVAVLYLAAAGGILASAHQSLPMLRIRRWATPIGVVFLALVSFSGPETDVQTMGSTLFVWGGAWIGGLIALTTLGDRIGLFVKKKKKPRPRSLGA